jgi:phosphodiesterase/alkaline phosphatase D-like protein
VDANVRNAVVHTGDVHRTGANDVKVDYKDPASPVGGSELVCTSTTSSGNGTGSPHSGGHYFKRQTPRTAQHLHRRVLRVVEAIEANPWSRI